MSPQKVQFENKNGQGITLTAVINFPEEFDKNNKYPAIVVTHPGGGVKEQTAGLYAQNWLKQVLSLLLMTPLIRAKAQANPDSWKILIYGRKISVPLLTI